MLLNEINDELIQLYKEMSKHTAPECATACRVPHSCCSGFYCDIAESYAKEVWNVELKPIGQHPTLKFMSPEGCTVAPHLRPLCTMHTCDISSIGAKKNDPDLVWTARYFEIRTEINYFDYLRNKQLEGEQEQTD